MTSPHTNAIGHETRREWMAPGAVRVVAERVNGAWTISSGPSHLIGRTRRNIRSLRDAVRNTPRPGSPLDIALDRLIDDAQGGAA